MLLYILPEIDHFRHSFREIKFIHEWGQHNGEAHSLAKVASSLLIGRHVWHSVLPDLLCIPMNINI
jgi:hypothetical protein